MDYINRGSTAIIKRYKPGIVIKCPDRPPGRDDIDHASVEKQILEILGHHPRIVNFLGPSKEEPAGLLFAEANRGDLQCYSDKQNKDIDESLRLKWCLQAAQAITYIHSKGVIHSDLRPENFLLHAPNDNDDNPDLLLCDFGGSYCETKGKVIDGGNLPDAGFFDPNCEWVSNKDVDIFALGSVLYVIMTGHWPYKSPGPFASVQEADEYDEKVEDLFMKREYPSVDGLQGGDIISDCWTKKIRDAGVIVARYDALIQMRNQERAREC